MLHTRKHFLGSKHETEERIQQVKESVKELQRAQRNLHIYGMHHLAEVVGHSIQLHNEEIEAGKSSH